MPALVQSAKGETTSIGGNLAVTASWATATTLGNFLLAAVQISGGSNGTLTTPGSWTKVGEIDNSTNVKAAMYFIPNAGVRSGADAITQTPAAYAELQLLEVSGMPANAIVESFQTNTGNSTAPVSAGLTTTQTTALLVASIGALFGGSMTDLASPTNSFTLQEKDNVGVGVTLDGGVTYRIVTSPLTTTSGVSINQTAPWAVLIASFAAPSAVRRRSMVSV